MTHSFIVVNNSKRGQDPLSLSLSLLHASLHSTSLHCTHDNKTSADLTWLLSDPFVIGTRALTRFIKVSSVCFARVFLAFSNLCHSPLYNLSASLSSALL